MQTQSLISNTYVQSWAAWPFRKKRTILMKSLRAGAHLLEALLGLHVGALVGWPVGWWLGSLYAACFEPTHQASFEQIRTWCYLPATYADYGFCVGAVIGLIAVRCCSCKILKNRIKALYEKGQMTPRQLAAALYRDEKKIEQMLNRMIEKNQITPEKEQ